MQPSTRQLLRWTGGARRDAALRSPHDPPHGAGYLLATEPAASDPARVVRAVHAGPVTGLISQVLLLVALAETVGLSSAGWVVGLSCGVIMYAALSHGLSRCRDDRLGLADWVTLARATLAIGVAALVADSFHQRAPVMTLVSLAALALGLDAVDGWVARRTRTTETLGAQFDGEVDAFLILVLSVYAARSIGVWVLAIGAARYAFLAAEWMLPWMRKPLPPRYWRKFVAATQGIVLTVAAADVLPLAVTQVALVAALILLAESFARDAWWLWRNRHAPHTGVAAGADSTVSLGLTTPAGRGRGRSSRRVGAVLTTLAVLIVWAALVAPDQPGDLTPTAFLRLPLEALVVIVLSLVLPPTARRLLAWIVGPALGLVVILHILDIGFFSAFDRPFDPLGDASYAGIGQETLRAAVGRTEATILTVGLVVLVVALLVLTTLAVLRLTRVVSDHRRRSLWAVAAVGSVWLLFSVSGARFHSHTPIASTSAAGLVVHEVRRLQADIHDQGVFAKKIRHDWFRNTPSDQLLNGLRGKDVLLVFVESYGQVTLQNSSYAPGVGALLDKGNKQLQAAGFSSRSAFVTSSTFGGISWLSHSTLQSGVWVNSGRRYNQVVTSNRFTLSDAFKRAGWRTIDDAPADDRAWPTGSSFYHYDKVYDRRDVGYRGPMFTYAPMPDQYMFSALQRLELAKTHRSPLFAEVDTVSSHMPWNRIPQMVPWGDVGDGSTFKRIPMDRNTDGAFWVTPERVRAAYLRSIEYSLNTLISFVQHYGKKNLVLVVVGDEQPLSIVSGHGASHNVPVSLIAHDPAVLDRIRGWGWNAGLRPSPSAPVWVMSAFRDRFLTAFGPRPATR